MLRTFVVRAAKEDGKADSLEALAIFVGKIASVLLEKGVAHNLVATKDAVYILPRQFETHNASKYTRSGFVELVGVAICRDEEGFAEMKAELYEKVFEEEVSLVLKQFNDLKDSILRALQTKETK